MQRAHDDKDTHTTLQKTRQMKLKVVCVLDMDETLGTCDDKTFHLRPKCKMLINFLQIIQCDIVLWSMGSNLYVEKVIKGTLTDIQKKAYKVYGRSKCKWSKSRYGFYKASEAVRKLYTQTVFLMGVDDRASQNMDSGYDLRIHVKPYRKPNPHDRALLEVIEKVIKGLAESQIHSVEDDIVVDLMEETGW